MEKLKSQRLRELKEYYKNAVLMEDTEEVERLAKEIKRLKKEIMKGG